MRGRHVAVVLLIGFGLLCFAWAERLEQNPRAPDWVFEGNQFVTDYTVKPYTGTCPYGADCYIVEDERGCVRPHGVPSNHACILDRCDGFRSEWHCYSPDQIESACSRVET